MKGLALDQLPLAELLARFGAGLSQHARLLTIDSAQDSALPMTLVAEAMSAREAVNDLFLFEVDALSVSAELDVSLFLGEELTVTLLQPDGSRRAWHGMCTAARLRGADGGMARYRLRLEPALHLLRLRHDSWIFQDKDLRGIVAELLADYPQVAFAFDVTAALKTRAICTQYRESDFAFFQRLLASEGLSWRFAHAPAGTDERHGKHTLIIFDSRAKLPAMPGGDALRFHGMRASDTDDAIDRFGARRQVQANAVVFSSWEPSLLVAPASERLSALDAGDLPQLSIYDGSGERQVADRAGADTCSDGMLKAAELENKQFEGMGAVRRLAPGHRFVLTRHERFPPGLDEFTVLEVRHEARNNFQPALRNGRDTDAGIYRNSFACVRACVPIVPPACALRRPATAPGAQSALVVGLADAIATTDRDHQVKVQFPWQRGRRPNWGGTRHDVDDRGNAPGDETSGTWVRVAEALAGPNWGTQFTPRIGIEVLVDFIEGDIDRPVVVSQLYNGADRPPFPGGEDSGANHAGTLSGIHSHSFDHAGYNQWVVDDTQGQLRMRLASSCAATQLNMGYLIDHAPTSSHRGAYRGSGFELGTEAWAIMRGGEGVFLSTSARHGQGCSVASTQMDARESLAGLKAAQDLGQRLGDAARHQQALYSDVASAAQDAFVKLVDPEKLGKHPDSVHGQKALKPAGPGRTLDPAAPVEKFGAPIVLMDSAASVNWATPASTVVYAGESIQWTTQGDTHFAAGHTYSSVSGEATSLFTHDGGIQAVAANGPVSLQAHTDELEILADQSITVISVNDVIEIKAAQRIVLQAGKSAITLDGGDITFACPGRFTVKSTEHIFDPKARVTPSLPLLPDRQVGEPGNFIAIHYRDAEGLPMAGVGYTIHFADGSKIVDKLDQQGFARHDDVPECPTTVEYDQRTPLPEQPWPPLEDVLSQARIAFTTD